MDNTNTKNMIYMMMSNQIAKYVGNDMYSPMIYMGLSTLLNFPAFSFDFSEDIIWYTATAVAIAIASFLSYKYYIFYRDDKLFKITFIYPENISAFVKYLEINGAIYKNNELTYGNLQDRLNLKANISNSYIDKTGRNPDKLKIYFKVDEDQLEGYYYYETRHLETTVESSDKTKITSRVEDYSLIVVFTRFEKSKNVGFFMNLMHKSIKEYDEKNIKLFYIKIISQYDKGKEKYELSNHRVEFYESYLETDKNYYENIFRNFFHSDKKQIINKVHSLEKNSENKISLLLHGPAGTGKSSFAYRLAKYFNRHIISFEINKMSKMELFQMFDTPVIDGQQKTYKDAVFVFDEFDKCFFEIYEREMINKKLFEERIKSSFSSHTEDNEGKDKKKNRIPLDDNSIKLNDLLELFQGVIPREGSIVIATTNHYEEINKLFPQLFRAGRLTPVYFGYLNKESFNELCLHYYEKDFPKDLPDTIKITPSEIIEMTSEMDFETFVESIMEKL